MARDKTCTRCKRTLSVDAFRIRKLRSGSVGLYSRCVECLNAVAREAGKAGIYKEQAKRKKMSQTPEQRTKIKLRLQNWHLQTKHGITSDQYDETLASQNGKCPICKSSNPRTRSGRFCVDHNHVTGQRRELLCFVCNAALGLLQEDPAFARNLADYIEKHSEASNGN